MLFKPVFSFNLIISLKEKYCFEFSVITVHNVSVIAINLTNDILFIITSFILYNIKKLIIRNKWIFIGLKPLLSYNWDIKISFN